MSAGVERDPFSDPWVDPIQRDQWGRPIIMRPDRPDGPCPTVRYCKITAGHGHYARVSTADGWLDDGIGLSTWKVRHVALAVARAAESTRNLIASCWYPTKKNPCPELNEFIDSALEQAKRDDDHGLIGKDSLRAADYGTAVHRFTVANRPPHVPANLAEDVDSYEQRIEQLGWKTFDSEIFVVNDELEVAGSIDDLFITPSGTLVGGDKKTGELRLLSFSIQLAMYLVNSVRYDPETGERSPLIPDGMTLHPEAFIIHVPLGAGKTDFVPVDLAKAWEAAKMARAVYDLRRHAEKGALLGVALPEEI